MKLKVMISLLIGLSFSSHSYAVSKLKDRVLVDGSSTVFPISEAVAEDFRSEFPRVRVAIGVSGTGGGFKKFLKGETDINNASRSIKSKEVKLAKKSKINYKEFSVAYDGISVVVNNDNTWVDELTVEELNKIWKPGSKVKTWKDIRASWPDKPLRLYGPGTDSGTFDYFTEAVNGKSHVSRSDYTKSEDDNTLVQGIVEDKYAMAYFGYAYYVENKQKIKAVPIKAKGAKKAVLPTLETIKKGDYKPLGRPVFIYVNQKSLAKEGVYQYIKHYFTNGPRLVKEVGYVPLTDDVYKKQLTTLETLRAHVAKPSIKKK